MFKKVWFRLTFFCALAIGLALFGITALCLKISEQGLRNSDFTDFQNNSNIIFTSVGNQTFLSHTWLTQAEGSYGIVIDILDGDHSLLYNSLHSHKDFQPLIEQARRVASETYRVAPAYLGRRMFTLSRSFSIKDRDGSDYYAAAAVIPKGDRYLDVVILHSTADFGAGLREQRFLFFCGASAAWLLLSVAAALLIGRLLRPIEENRQNQARFIAAASHELRSPLTVILTSLCAARISGKEEQSRFFDSIESEGRRMKRLIDDMLALASSDAQSWSIHPQKTEADTLLLEIYEKYETSARQKNLRLQIELPEHSVPGLLCDRERILQVLSVLVDNALSYTPPGGTVVLSLSQSEKYLSYSVRDNGPGIPDEQKAKIFERFYRADSAHRDKNHFGLGLCIAKEIVVLHRGRIEITDAPDGGSIFSVLLPSLPRAKSPI